MAFVHDPNDKGFADRRRTREGGPVTFPDDVPVLSDGVVTLRSHRAEDADGVLDQCLDPVSQLWTTVPVPYTREHAEGFVTEVVPAGWDRGRWAFAVESADDSGTRRFAGTVELRDEGNRRAEIAYGLAAWARGRGVVHRALLLLLEWGFTSQHLRTVSWWANRGNWPSRRAAWRLGFSCDGTVRRWLPQRGDLLDGWVGVLHADAPRSPETAWLEVPRLAGERVVLRPLGPADVPRIVDACRDHLTTHWLRRVPRAFDTPDAEEWLLERGEMAAEGSGLGWAVADPADDRLVGYVGAGDISAGRGAELGWWTHPDARGRGVTTEACGLVVRHCFRPDGAGGLGLQRLHVDVGVGNAASIRVAEANGFRRVGLERRGLLLGDGSLTDRVVLDLLAEEVPSAT
jgi:RimJ/RimL family protein N-acetyltransferase